MGSDSHGEDIINIADRRSSQAKPVETSQTESKASESSGVSDSANASASGERTEDASKNENANQKETVIELKVNMEDLSKTEKFLVLLSRDNAETIQLLIEYVNYLHAGIIVLSKHTRLDRVPADFNTFVNVVRPKMQRMKETGIIEPIT